MRAAKRQNPLQAQVSRAVSIPAPTGGWDAVSPLAAMPPDRAVILDNFICRPGAVELRRGYVQHVSGLNGAVQSLMVYRGLPTGDKLLAAVGGAIYDVTNPPLGAPLFNSATSAAWQYVNFATLAGTPLLIACNGSDTPIQYNGAAIATISFSGSSGTYTLNPKKLSAVCAYMGFLFFIESGTLHVWYPASEAVSGTMTLFDLSSIFDKGGRLIACSTWAVNYDAATSEYVAFLTDQGQVAIYQGTNPNQAATWALVAILDLGLPLGPRALVKYGADLVVITADGVVPLSQALTIDRSQDDTVALTQRIQNAFAQAARAYRANFGWEACLYAGGMETSNGNTQEGGGSLIIVNVPIVGAGTGAVGVGDGSILGDGQGDTVGVASGAIASQQFVQNVQTGAWSRFLNLPALCWAVANQMIFFGTTGAVCQWDIGSDDNGQPMTAEVKGAFNSYGLRAQSKLFTMIRPLLYTSAIVLPAIDIDTDYQNNPPTAVPVVIDPGATTPEMRYDWTAVGAVGYVGAPHMVVSVQGDLTAYELGDGQGDVIGAGGGVILQTQDPLPFDVPLQLIGFDLMFKPGGQL